jgi:hypothetical protein
LMIGTAMRKAKRIKNASKSILEGMHLAFY